MGGAHLFSQFYHVLFLVFIPKTTSFAYWQIAIFGPARNSLSLQSMRTSLVAMQRWGTLSFSICLFFASLSRLCSSSHLFANNRQTPQNRKKQQARTRSCGRHFCQQKIKAFQCGGRCSVKKCVTKKDLTTDGRHVRATIV